MRLKIGTFASSGSSFFNGIVNWLIGANNGKLFASENGTLFQEVQSPFGTSNVNDVFYGRDLSQVSGSAFLAAADGGKLGYSTDGITWTTRNIEGTNNYSSIAYGNSLYYAGGT